MLLRAVLTCSTFLSTAMSTLRSHNPGPTRINDVSIGWKLGLFGAPGRAIVLRYETADVRALEGGYSAQAAPAPASQGGGKPWGAGFEVMLWYRKC